MSYKVWPVPPASEPAHHHGNVSASRPGDTEGTVRGDSTGQDVASRCGSRVASEICLYVFQTLFGSVGLP